jgi:hypothetical protein
MAEDTRSPAQKARESIATKFGQFGKALADRKNDDGQGGSRGAKYKGSAAVLQGDEADPGAGDDKGGKA